MDHRECRMKQEKIAAMERIIAADYANIAGMVVLKDGECIYENYFGGCTENSRIHVSSVTKSVVSVLIGLCRRCFLGGLRRHYPCCLLHTAHHGAPH